MPLNDLEHDDQTLKITEKVCELLLVNSFIGAVYAKPVEIGMTLLYLVTLNSRSFRLRITCYI